MAWPPASVLRRDEFVVWWFGVRASGSKAAIRSRFLHTRMWFFLAGSFSPPSPADWSARGIYRERWVGARWIRRFAKNVGRFKLIQVYLHPCKTSAMTSIHTSAVRIRWSMSVWHTWHRPCTRTYTCFPYSFGCGFHRCLHGMWQLHAWVEWSEIY